MKENLDIDNWENVRGPRPWEEDEQKYIDIIQKRIEETEAKRKKKGSFWAAWKSKIAFIHLTLTYHPHKQIPLDSFVPLY